jgi:sporulation protein YqfC
MLGLGVIGTARHKIRKRPPEESPAGQSKNARQGKEKRESPGAVAVMKAARALDLPVDLVAGMVHFDFSGNREVTIEGCRGILEYDENIICVDTGKMTVRFMGRDLELRNFTDHSAVINGYIASVEFLGR